MTDILRAPSARRSISSGNRIDIDALRLRDRVGRHPRVVFVGINPGVRSALTGHHFAGYSNRFWKLLYESGLVEERLRPENDVRLPEFGYALTNLIARPTPGIDALRRDEFVEGVRVLKRKVRRWRPEVVAFVGITLFRAIFAVPGNRRVALGVQAERFEGARVFVLPNPSGRNANYTYGEMHAAFRGLATILRRRRSVVSTRVP